jgi:hypothetical protein
VTLQSTKSASVSAPQANKWRLRRTLKRRAEFRPIENGDVRYTFAAYRKGSLSSLGEDFANTDMNADEFKAAFEGFVLKNFHAVWTLFATTPKGVIPVGIVFAEGAPNGPYMIVTAAVWFPWASKRNMVEAMVSFLDSVRKQVALVFYAVPEHKRMYEVCAMHGVVRRVGTSYTVIPGKAAAVFETRVK